MSDPTKAAIEYLQIKARYIHPNGKFDKAGRWYPDIMESCCEAVSQPTRSYPYALMLHCRTLKHIAHSYNIEESEIRYVLKHPILFIGIEDDWVKSYLETVLKK